MLNFRVHRRHISLSSPEGEDCEFLQVLTESKDGSGHWLLCLVHYILPLACCEILMNMFMILSVILGWTCHLLVAVLKLFVSVGYQVKIIRISSCL